MITAHEATAIRKVVRRLIKAEIDNSWKGGGPPECIPEIEEDLRLARLAYNSCLKNRTLPDGEGYLPGETDG